MSKTRAGLPETIKFRNDAHFVEELGTRRGSAIGRMIPIDEIEPNPNQPRQQMGDLTELTSSIREKGILEPLIVRRQDSVQALQCLDDLLSRQQRKDCTANRADSLDPELASR